MTGQVTAILDRPSAASLGMVGVVVTRSDGTSHTLGVLGSQGGKITDSELDDLIRGGHGIRVEPVTIDPAESPTAALWIGTEFAELTERAGVPLPPIPQQAGGQVPAGRFWIAPARHVWRVLDSWILLAFRGVVERRDESLATLMTWAIPNRAETRAAQWLTSSTVGRTRDLEWWSRLERDQGHTQVTPDALEATFSRLVHDAQERPLSRVVGFSAPAKGGDKEIAKFVAQETQLQWVSFGGWLQDKARKEGLRDDRPNLQRLGQMMIERRGELSLCLEVLDAIGAGLPKEPFLIEGIRHLKVFHAVQFLVGSDRFDLAFVDRPLEERQALLLQEGLSHADVERVLSDPTETEIPMLKGFARWNLDARSGAEAGARTIVQALRT